VVLQPPITQAEHCWLRFHKAHAEDRQDSYVFLTVANDPVTTL
jgi:hypothetical protein